MALDQRNTWKDRLWQLNPFKMFAYRVLCTLNAFRAIWTKKNLVFNVVPEGGRSRVHIGIIIESKGRAYVTTPILDIYMTPEQTYLLAGTAERAIHFLGGKR